MFGSPSYLRYRPKRYKCAACGKTTTQTLDWKNPHSPNSISYEMHVLRQLIGSTIQDVSRKEGVSYARIGGILQRWVDGVVAWHRYEALPLLGLDEIALRKGHGNFVTLVSARLKNGQLVLLAVLPDRKKETVVEFLRSIPAHLAQSVQTVCTDMYEGFTAASEEVLPQAQVVVDRFHVSRQYRQAVDDLRKTRLRQLKADLPEATYARFKGHMWALRTPKAKRSAEQKRVLKRVFRHAPDLKQADTFQAELTAIFETAKTHKKALRQLKRWRKKVAQSTLTCFDAFLKTLENWWPEITAYFLARHSSGFVEGLNNKIKVIKRRCYGIYNLEHLFQRIFLDLSGYGCFPL